MENKTQFETNKWLLDRPNDLISIEKWQRTVNLLSKLFEAPAGFLVQHTEQGFQVTISSEQSTNPYPAGVIIEPDVNIFCRLIVETNEQLYVANAPEDPYWDTNPEVHNDGFVSYLGVPVYWPNGETFGTFCVMDYKVTDYQQTYIDLIHQLKDILESDLSMIQMYNQAQKLAITDTLTDIHNRRGFEVLAEQRLFLAKRAEKPLGLFYFDIDNFKQINDQYGHSHGDAVLKVVAQALQQSIRSADVIGRMGGDEFVALVQADSTNTSDQILQRFEENIQALQQGTDTPAFSVSSGYTEVDFELSISEIIDIADALMLNHKKKNREDALVNI